MDIKRNPDQGKGNYLLRVSRAVALEFPTESEARQAMAKLETARAILAMVQSLTVAADGAGDRWQEYWDLRNAGGDFLDADLAPLGITAAQLSMCIGLLDAFVDFISGADQGGAQIWRATINQVRRVQL